MKIKYKLFCVAILVLFSMVALIVTMQHSVTHLIDHHALDKAISQAEKGLLKLRQSEKDFLQNLELKDSDEFNKRFQRINTDLDRFGQAVIDVGMEGGKTKLIRQKFQQYHEIFNELVNVQKKIGLHSRDGIYGDLRAVVHKAENEIKQMNDQELRSGMLQLRRNEKDFLLRMDLKHQSEFDDNFSMFQQNLKQGDYSDEDIDSIAQLMEEYSQSFHELVRNIQIKGLNPHGGLLRKLELTFTDTERVLMELSNDMHAIVEDEVGSTDQLIVISDIIGIVLTLIVLGAIYWVVVSVTGSVSQLSNTITRVAETNDLSLRHTINSQDEISEAGSAFNYMMEKFQFTLQEVNQASEQLSVAAGVLSESSRKTDDDIQRQQQQTRLLASAMEEIVHSVNNVAKNAGSGAEIAAAANDGCNRGQKVVSSAADSIHMLSERVHHASGAIQRLQKDSESIGSVLDVIRGIAEQTNLLALNAAIEAARAGEQGRGFAVVADEVRTLAGRTQNSTTEIQNMIESLQSLSREAVTLMEESQCQTKQGVEHILEAGESLNHIVAEVANINDMNAQIATVTEQQKSVMEEVNHNVSTINNIAENSVALSNETAQASHNLANLAAQLRNLSSQFKV
ncbi:MAG: hypothetical protein CSA50_02950 [Gammaproteobacteria bacterium]|nr:MAG: hypothetical protein CSA50_02950 [Gammaproteobacteria bacterium]